MKQLTILFAVCIALSLVSGIAGASTPVESLGEVERILYGSERTGALLERIASVERDIFGEVMQGAVLIRIDRARAFLIENRGDGPSLYLQLNLAEWGFLARLTQGQPLIDRITKLEKDLLGLSQSGSLAERSRDLMMMIWGTTDLDIRPVELREGSLVRIRLLTEVDSGKVRVGDEVAFRVIEDVQVEGRIVIPAGAEGYGVIKDVVSAGRLGRDGRVDIDFRTVSAFDGVPIRLKVDEKATEKNLSLELAAGASMAGVILLGPLGLVSGYFVKGRDIHIPAGTEFFVETERTTRTTGFLLRPSSR